LCFYEFKQTPERKAIKGPAGWVHDVSENIHSRSKKFRARHGPKDKILKKDKKAKQDEPYERNIQIRKKNTKRLSLSARERKKSEKSM